MKKLKTNQGITLIALIITIIVMLILVGVSISIALNTGLFDSAGKATQDYKTAQEAEQELGSGKVNISGTTYENIDDYVAEVQKEKITFYIRCGSHIDGKREPLKYIVQEGTTWEQFLSNNQVVNYVDGNGKSEYYLFDLVDSAHCAMFGLPDGAIGTYCYCKSAGGPFLEDGVNFQTGPWIFPDTLIKDGATYGQ